MMKRSDLQALATTRLDDALLLLGSGRPSSAYYLAGYAVELALKACIARAFHADVIPDKAFVNEIYKHDLDSLLGTAGLAGKFRHDAATDPELRIAWGVVANWSEARRYVMWDNFQAERLVGAIANMQHGVFQWVKTHW